MRDWYTTFFNQNALDVWQRSRSPLLTAAEVDFLDRRFGLEKPGRLLDLACGNGRHAAGLAARGHRVVGVDITEANRERVAASAVELDVEVEFVVGDMKDLNIEGTFDGALLWGNSLGYFDRSGMRTLFAGVAARLEPGARFVIDTATAAECILLDLSRRTFADVSDTMRVLIESSYDATESRLDTIYTTIESGRVVDTSTAHVWVFTSGEIIALASDAGFDCESLASSVDDEPFELGCDQLILTFSRR